MSERTLSEKRRDWNGIRDEFMYHAFNEVKNRLFNGHVDTDVWREAKNSDPHGIFMETLSTLRDIEFQTMRTLTASVENGRVKVYLKVSVTPLNLGANLGCSIDASLEDENGILTAVKLINRVLKA